ncbi:MAG: hypothetical protein ACWGPS_03025 [Candidatus Promineifilaceae bacterium]
MTSGIKLGLMSRFSLLALGTLILGLLLAGVQLGAASTQPDSKTNWRFGVIESYEDPQAARQLGVSWTRVPFNWADLQAEGPDTWTPKVSQEKIDQEMVAGQMVVGLLIGIPEWARDQQDLPKGLWLDADDPGNTWATFVRQAVSRHRGRIDHWIIWNEPDIADSEIAHTWHGSVADFAQLQQTAYRAAKEVNPSAVIHLSAFTYWADYYAGTEQYMARLLDEIVADPQAAQHNYYFDVATAHLYFQPSQIYDLTNLFVDIMRQRGMDQPIWLVETNAPPKDDPGWPVSNWTLSVTQQEQAAYIPQALAAALAAGVERVAVYKLRDTADDKAANPEPFGLVRSDGSRRPAFESYQVAVQNLAGVESAERERWDEVGQIRMNQADQTTTIVFARLPQPQQAEITALNDTALLIDMRGVQQPITATQGIFTIDLPPARCSQSIGDYCMIGGPPFYLVQEGRMPTPTPTSTPTATATATATAAVTPEPSPTAVATVVATEAAATPLAVVNSNPFLAPTIPRPATSELAAPAAGQGSWGLWFVGGGLLLAVALGFGLLRLRRRT